MEIYHVIAYVLISLIFISTLIYLLKRMVKLFPLNNIEWYIAKRYFYSTKNKGFISLISSISIIGMVLGSASVIVAASFMNGMQKEVMSRVISADSHIKIRGYLNKTLKNFDSTCDSLRKMDGIIGVSPKVFNYALIGVGQGSQAYPVIVNGLDENNFRKVNSVDAKVIEGKFEIKSKRIFNPKLNDYQDKFGIVLGKYLADRMNLSNLDTGKLITLAAIPDKIDFNSTFTLRSFYFAGIVDLGFPEYDQTYAFTSIKAAQNLFMLDNEITYIDIKLKDENRVDEFVELLDKKIDFPMVTKSWKDDWASHFSIMEWEKKVYMICLGLIICLAGFNILSTLYMLVKDKTKEIGILRSLGLNSKNIMKVFINQGILIGIIGALGGFILSMTTLYIQDTYHVISFPANTLVIDYLPVLINWNEVISTLIFTVFIASLTGIYPAYQAAKLNPVEAFKYE